MGKRYLLIFMIYLLQSIGAFEIVKERVEVTKKGSEITVKIPNDSDLKSVFLAVEFSDHCTVDFKYMVNNNNNTEFLSFTQNVINEPKENDVIRLLGVFETKDQVIQKTLDYKIGVDGNGKLQRTVPENEFNLSETYVNYTCTYRRGELIFQEYFNENMSQWQNEVRTLWYSAVPFQESVVYTNDRETCELKNGTLLLKAKWNGTTLQKLHLLDCTSMKQNNKKDECGPFTRIISPIPSIFSAKVYSYPFKFKYGRVEIRARFALGNWLLPYIMLQDRENMNIDLGSHIRMYARGNPNLQDNNNNQIGAETLFGSAFLMHPSGEIIELMHSFRNKDATPLAYEFHDYTIIWRRDKLIFKIDGITFGSIKNETILNVLSERERAIAFGLTAGGGLNFPDDYILPDQKDFKNDHPNVATQFVEAIMTNETQNTWTKPYMEIDYVKVYSLDTNEQ
ncbi:gram-negative bacteria-binding protein 2-like [Drosophila sulfurigaster albostrigata]|uniref:gram-negative bacteria-binding protein 2-like n=1 Tax=Drosophila sulfurigaster albostrigata TaxID=89887 RepID=UPI002D21DE21|nr:gram-negative bacteria-binding protein 2-like [Drosophila sulfurigaster albostrigata]